MNKKYSDSMLAYFKTLDEQMSDIEKVAFQQTVITSLEKELSKSKLEIGFLKSELDEVKYQLAEIRKPAEGKSLLQQVQQLRENNKQLRIEKGILAQNLDFALKLSEKDKIKIKKDKDIEAMKVQIASMSKNITKLRQDKEALIISLGKIKLV
jgi:hypothetical protein